MPVITESLALHSLGFCGEVGCKGPRIGITHNAACVSFHSASSALCKAEKWHSKGRCNSCSWEHLLVPHTPSRGSASPYHLVSLNVITAIFISFPQKVTEISNKTCKEGHLNDCANSKRKASNKWSRQVPLPMLGKLESQTKFWLGDFLFWVWTCLFIFSL